MSLKADVKHTEVAATLKKEAKKKGNDVALGRLQELLGDDIDLSDVGNVKSAWIKTGKDKEGNTKVSGASIQLTPSWDSGPEWPVVQQAKPVTIRVPVRKVTTKSPTGWQTALIVPDTQIGYRQLIDGSLDPFHDETAIDVAMQIAEYLRPDLTIHLGDLIDFAEFGKYRQEPGFAYTTQKSIDRSYELLASLAAVSGETRLLEGNHDARLGYHIIDNAKASFGLTQAKPTPEAWPVMSLQSLLRLDELGIEYIGGYPVGATYINERLCCIHGTILGNKLKTAAQAVVESEAGISVVFGHTHHRNMATKTRNGKGHPIKNTAYSPGCLCRVDGAVPGTKAATDVFGKPVRFWQDWQQGVGVIHFEPEGYNRFIIEDIPIEDGYAQYRGQEFHARCDMDRNPLT